MAKIEQNGDGLQKNDIFEKSVADAILFYCKRYYYKCDFKRSNVLIYKYKKRRCAV